jgi:hypothetical protein
MSDELLYNERKEWARTLYTRLDYSLRDVALTVGMEEAIVRQWIRADAWDEIRTSLLLSKTSQLRVLYGQLEKLTTKLTGDELLTAKDIDQYTKCVNNIQALEAFPAISEIIEIFDLFIQWLRKKDLALTQKLIVQLDAFLEQRIAA